MWGDAQEAHRVQPLIKSRVRAAVLGLLQAEGDARACEGAVRPAARVGVGVE